MKRRYVVGICLIVWALCIALSACTRTTYELPADTSAIEEYIETTSAVIAEEDVVEETTSETAPEEPLSDFDKAIFLAEQIVSDSQWSEFQLYDMDFDGIPELMAHSGFMDTLAWEIYKLTGDEAVNIGYIEYRDNVYNSVTGLTFGDGLHIYRDKEIDEVFYVGEYSTELHTEGHYECSKFRICDDRLDKTVISRCEFYTYDDCGNSGNRYIYYNDIAGQPASPRYRVDSNAEGFRFCNELEEYLSQYEYLGIIDGTNTFSAKSGGNFLEYAEQFRNLPKLKDEQVYVDKTEYVTVCGTEYDINSYSAKIKITEENFDSIDFTELKKLPKLELLTIDNLTEKEIDIAPLNELENLRWLDISGEYDKEQLKEFDKLEFLNNGAPLEILVEMDSLKCIDAGGKENLSALYDMKQLEAVKYCYVQQQNGEIDKLAEKRPDLLLIYVP